jgi:hypothetical protein
MCVPVYEVPFLGNTYHLMLGHKGTQTADGLVQCLQRVKTACHGMAYLYIMTNTGLIKHININLQDIPVDASVACTCS